MSGAQYMAGRSGWKSYLHSRSADRHARQAERQGYRAQLGELTGGRLSTGRSHRGFHSAMGAAARRGEGAAAMDAYFSKRQARLAKYGAMRGGVSPHRGAPGREASLPPLPSPDPEI